jgi:hypothetical protein
MTDSFEKLVQGIRDAVKAIDEMPVIDMDEPILHLGENLRADGRTQELVKIRVGGPDFKQYFDFTLNFQAGRSYG